MSIMALMNGRVHGVGAHGALKQLVDARGRGDGGGAEDAVRGRARIEGLRRRERRRRRVEAVLLVVEEVVVVVVVWGVVDLAVVHAIHDRHALNVVQIHS